MPEIAKPVDTTYWVVTSADQQIVHQGYTEPHQVTTTGQPLMESSTSENEHLLHLNVVAGAFSPLPEMGEPLQEGEIYNHNDVAVMVRQSHVRTEHEPSDVPALFLIHRVDDSIDWIAGESVLVGNVRVYENIEYRCIQAHVTQADWQPPNVPALWAEVQSPSNQWAAGVAYTIGDEVEYQGLMYRCQQSHTSLPGWEPPNVPALWLQI